MTPRDLWSVHTTGGVTGRFRVRRGLPMEAEVQINVTARDGTPLHTYKLWRPATDADHVEAAVAAGIENRA